MIESIELLDDTTVLVICSDEVVAKKLLKRNPKCNVQSSEDDRYGLVYHIDQTNLINAIKRN